MLNHSAGEAPVFVVIHSSLKSKRCVAVWQKITAISFVLFICS